ncbi:hypothetical protein N7537_004308 [Penicillium hordei]|uniref:SH3 domain-containing protein n=1 Tax=Penicillium hordei TaxID=40994 RepID=A0AAD6EB85_9EURO|nr:uncharacterized protein N7537_004308 [Penicillium hordei]KAJ5607689.1 hypothetical protein N7537_004308 [Penicillium hordei]
MSSIIGQGIAGHLNADWKPSQPSAAPAPARRKDLDNNNIGTVTGQQGAWQATQDARNTPSQQSPSDKQAPSNTQDDGQYHPNQPKPQASQLAKAPDAANQETTLGQQASSLTPQNRASQQLSPNNQAPSNTQDDGQYHPSQQLSSNKQAAPITQDDGLYHPNSAGGNESSSTLSNGQYNPKQQPAEGHPQMNQASTATQHGSSTNAYDSQQLGWSQVAPESGSWNSVVDATQSPTPTQLHPTGHGTSTTAPPIPTNSESDSSASSPAARAGIALSVCAAVALIALLILFPLCKRRKRLQKVLGDSQKEATAHDPPLHGAAQPLHECISKFYSHSARLVFSTTAFMRLKRQTSNPAPYFGDTHVRSETNNNAIVPHKSPRIEICPAPQDSPPASVSSWETELSKSHSNSSLAPSEAASLQTGSPNPDHVNGLGTLENLSVGNLVAVNPLMKNIYTVEMDYSSRRAGQLDLQVGQRLCIMQAFDNGWAMGVRLDCPEGGLVPRSHLSVEPENQPIRCAGEQRKSNRYSLNERAFSLGSRFYSLFHSSAQDPHSSPV